MMQFYIGMQMAYSCNEWAAVHALLFQNAYRVTSCSISWCVVDTINEWKGSACVFFRLQLSSMHLKFEINARQVKNVYTLIPPV